MWRFFANRTFVSETLRILSHSQTHHIVAVRLQSAMDHRGALAMLLLDIVNRQFPGWCVESAAV